MNICKNCVYYEVYPMIHVDECRHDQSGHVDPVSGKRRYASCQQMRGCDGYTPGDVYCRCGWEGKLFEAKNHPTTPS